LYGRLWFPAAAARRRRRKGDPMNRAIDGAALSYYAGHGIMTDPGSEADMLSRLPTDVGALCRICHGLVIHLLHAHRYRVELSESRKREVQIRRVQEKLMRMRELDSRPAQVRRPPNLRVVGTCRDYAVLLCSMMREQGRPARVRAGF